MSDALFTTVAVNAEGSERSQVNFSGDFHFWTASSVYAFSEALFDSHFCPKGTDIANESLTGDSLCFRC